MILLIACSNDEGDATDKVTIDALAASGAEAIPSQSVELATSRPLSRELAGGASDSYTLTLEAGEFVSLVVEQVGIDVIARLFDPAGALLIQFDKLTGTAEPEQVLWVAETPGTYQLEIAALADDAAAGRYELELATQRPATDADRQRATAEQLLAEGDALRRQGGDSRNLAESRFLEAIALWRQLGDRSRESQGYYRLGLTYQDTHRSIAAFEQALEALEGAPNPWREAATHHWLGHLHFRLGDLERAAELYRQALPLRRRAGDSRGEALTHNNLGLTYQILGEIPAALEQYRLALEIYRDRGDSRHEAQTLHNLGKSYLATGLARDALDSLSRALEFRQRLGDLAGQASTLNAIGQARAVNEELDLALAAQQQALELSRRTDQHRLEAIALSDTALMQHELGHAQAALDLFDQSLAIFRALGDRHNEANTLYNIGLALDASGQNLQASDHYRQALALYEATQNRHGKISTLHSMALAEIPRGELTLARSRLETALSEIERLRIKPRNHSLRYSYFATKQSYYETYVDLLMELHRRQPGAGYAAAALTASERARARSQLDALTESNIDLQRGADPELRAREGALEKEIESLELQRIRILELESSVSELQLPAIERQLRELFIEHGRVQGQIRIASPQYAALTQPRPLDAADIQRRVVDRDTILLEYALGEERSYLWAVTPDAVSSFELPPQAEIEKTAKRAYKLLSSSHLTATRAQTELALDKLSRWLLLPVARLLGDKRLLIVSEGALQYIPFGALPTPAQPEDELGEKRSPDDRRAPLGELHEIVSMPSASTLAVLRSQLGASRTNDRIAVLADPVFGPEDPRLRDAEPAGTAVSIARGLAQPEPRRYPRLIFSRQEADDILSLVPAAKSLAAIGFDANREAIMGGHLAHYRYLHFATHGELNTAHPELSRLVLSQVDPAGEPREGFVFAHEIYNLELAAELVVLSACQTALGAEIRGEGLLGLTQGFMYAGAASVIVSLWSVDDQATAELMARLYRGLLVDNLRPAAALKAAQASIRHEKRWAAPYYWAGFILQGEWR